MVDRRRRRRCSIVGQDDPSIKPVRASDALDNPPSPTELASDGPPSVSLKGRRAARLQPIQELTRMDRAASSSALFVILVRRLFAIASFVAWSSGLAIAQSVPDSQSKNVSQETSRRSWEIEFHAGGAGGRTPSVAAAYFRRHSPMCPTESFTHWSPHGFLATVPAC